MTTIANLSMWKDTGYTDGATEIPFLSSELGEPDYVYTENVFPSKERVFSELQLKEDYLTLLDMSYLRMDLKSNNTETLTVYGWIDDILLQSDNKGCPMTVIKWHTDIWRTFGGKAEYGSGFVVRRPSTDNDFYQNFPHNNQKVKDRTPLIVPQLLDTETDHCPIWWVIFAFVKEQDVATDDSQTYNQIAMYPMVVRNGSPYAQARIRVQDPREATTTYGYCPTMEQSLRGLWDEFYAIDPTRITGCWLSPVCPEPNIAYRISWNPTDNLYDMTMSSIGSFDWVKLKDDNFVFALANGHRLYSRQVLFENDIKSKEGAEVIITGFNGEKIGTIPYQRSVNYLEYRFRLSMISAYIELRFNGINSSPEGLQFDIPLENLDCNDNSWSQYVYSGQRDYDIQQRNINSRSGLVEGAGGGALSGGMMGAIAGGAAKGAIAGPWGIALGIGIGVAASVVGNGMDLMKYNHEFQDSEDQYHASQSEGIFTTGMASDIIFHGADIGFAVCVYDDASNRAIEDIKKVQGVKYNVPVQDCSVLIADGGPLQIRNLIVRGKIPTTAKKWIQEKFASGVRII